MKASGFTLIELMVALFIFAMLAAAGVALLSFGVRAQAAATERLDRIADERRMSVLLAADFSQAVPRLARDRQGATVRAFTGNDGTSEPLVLGYVRSGWTNPDDQPRASVQRVDVVLDAGRLIRRAYRHPDGSEPATSMLLADRVAALGVRYRDKDGQWRARWDNVRMDAMPIAVELTLTRQREAPLTMAFVVGTGR